jgi:hypothetical protein
VLVGEDTGDDDRRVYIGQSGDLRARLAQHHQKKDFWQRALVLISRTNSLTQTHALFLEWHALQQLRQVGRFRDENGTSGSRPHTPAPLEADCMEIFETGSTLFSTLGFPLFDPLASAIEAENPAELFFCRSPGPVSSAKASTPPKALWCWPVRWAASKMCHRFGAPTTPGCASA